MKQIITIILLTAVSCAYPQNEASEAMQVSAETVEVIDGDTVKVRFLVNEEIALSKRVSIIPDKEYSVRLILIDCMETSDNDRLNRMIMKYEKKGAYLKKSELTGYGIAAKDYLNGLLSKGSVLKLFIFTADAVDIYGRVLAVAYYGDICINHDLVKRGLAMYYKYGNVKGKIYQYYSGIIKRAEEFAKYKRYGVWEYLDGFSD